MLRPAILCSGFGSVDFIRVLRPAARIRQAILLDIKSFPFNSVSKSSRRESPPQFKDCCNRLQHEQDDKNN
jgi:hypothetical protein